VLTTTNKRLLISGTRGDSNRCTPCLGNLIHTTRMLPALVHIYHSYASCSQSPYVATFHTNPIELDRFTTFKKKCFRVHLLTWLSGPRDPPQFLSRHLLMNMLDRFTRLISPACDQYVQYLLTGANPLVLT
jgi:hypothetical protein